MKLKIDKLHEVTCSHVCPRVYLIKPGKAYVCPPNWSPNRKYHFALIQLVKTDGIQCFQFGNQNRKTNSWQQRSIARSKLEIVFESRWLNAISSLGLLRLKATFHLTISLHGQRATSKIQKNNYHHGSYGLSLTGKTSSVSLIFTHGTHQNVKNRWVRRSLKDSTALWLVIVERNTSSYTITFVKLNLYFRENSHKSYFQNFRFTLYKLYAVPVRICITRESYHQYPWVISSVPVRVCITRESYHQYPWVISSVPVSHIISTREDMQYPWVISSVPASHILTGTAYPHGYWGYDSRVLRIWLMGTAYRHGTEDMTHGYCISSHVLRIWLKGTEDMTHGYCISSRVLMIWLTGNAYLHGYCIYFIQGEVFSQY